MTRTATIARFRALARSSPWRWDTLRFTWESFTGPDGGRPRGTRLPVRALVRRPGGLRVEDLEGVVRQVDEPFASRTDPRRPDRAMLYRVGYTSAGVEPTEDAAMPDSADDEVAVFDDDGFVRKRPWLLAEADEPMWQNYTFVAALDPVELTDGRDGTVGTRIEDVTEVDHRGRVAWEAIVHPAGDYEPRCHCCSLLLAPQSFEGFGGPPEGVQWPDAHWVRLDVQTGVCVVAEQIGGSRAGTGHEIVIEAVDEPMPDELFTTRRRSGFPGVFGR